MKRRSRRILAATAAIALASSLLGIPYLAGLPDPHAGFTVPATPFPNASWQQVLMAGRW
ncbi:MAG: hypothetical protein ABJA84_01180 [Polaromonas sp.]